MTNLADLREKLESPIRDLELPDSAKLAVRVGDIRALLNLLDAKEAREREMREALEKLVEDCSGEVEEVFRGEIGDALAAARLALSAGGGEK